VAASGTRSAKQFRLLQRQRPCWSRAASLLDQYPTFYRRNTPLQLRQRTPQRRL